MKFDNEKPSKTLKNKALDVKKDCRKIDDKSRKKLYFWRWLFSFVTLVIVPNCQSMASQNPPSNMIVINQIGQQNVQTVNISYNIQTQNK